MQSVTVIKAAVSIKSTKQVSLHQDHDESFQTLQPVFEVKQKLVISLQLVNVERKMLQFIQKKQLKT